MSLPTKVIQGQKAKEIIIKGVKAIYEPIRKTLGPGGSNMLIYGTYGRTPRITNDGVTGSECIEPADEFEKIVAQAFKEAAKRTNERAGDGTTATTVIGGFLLKEIFAESPNIETIGGAKPLKGSVMEIRRQLLESAKTVIEEITKSSKKVTKIEELIKVATVSVENAEIGKIIANMVWDVGVEGFVSPVEGYKLEIETEVIKGMRFSAKICGKFFVNNKERFEMIAQDCPVIVTNHKVDSVTWLIELANRLKLTKLIIIAPDFSDQALNTMALSYKNNFLTYPVKAPSLRTDQFEDISIFCGSSFINKEAGGRLEYIHQNNVGFLEKLIVKDSESKEDAVATGGKGIKKEIDDRIATLKAQIVETKQDIYKKMLEKRIASLASAVGVIRVGATTEAQQKYLLKKVEDAVYACKAALEEGYVEGGGLCLKKIADKLPKDDILKNALLSPYNQIQENAGGIAISKDIIDPTKVVRLSVEHAIGVVSNLITVDSIIVEQTPMEMGEGYTLIADAIKGYNKLFAKQHGIVEEAQKDSEGEMERRRVELEHNDI